MRIHNNRKPSTLRIVRDRGRRRLRIAADADAPAGGDEFRDKEAYQD